jgi:signal transduction histidine kinase
MSSRSRIFIAAIIAAVLAQCVFSYTLRPGFALTVLTDLSQSLLLASAALAFLPMIRRTEGRSRWFWRLIALSLLFWTAYEITWTFFEVILRKEVPNPFVGDVVLFLHLVPMIAALAVQPYVEHDERTARLGSLDFTLLLTWWVYLYLFIVIPWQYIYINPTRYDLNFNDLYLTEKVALLAGLLWGWLRSSKSWKRIYAQLFGATALYALSSYLANWAIERKAYYTGSVYDVSLTISIAWMGLVGLQAVDLPLNPEPPTRAQGYGVWVARLGMITIFTLPIFAAICAFDDGLPPAVRSFRLLVTLSTMTVIGGLVFVKQHLLDRELLALLRNSRDSFENLKRLQNQLVQSEKLASLGQLVGGAAHELNNPLTAMLGYSDLLASTQLQGEQRALAQKIGHQVRRTKILVSDLLSFAKQTPAEKTPLDLNSLIHTAVKLSQPQLRTQNVEVRPDLAPGLPLVLGDSNQLLQVCIHIINNALYAMTGTGGCLRITSLGRPNLVHLEFSDNGPGVPDPDRAFDPFYTHRPVGQGRGLGLSACYGIIQEHNGKIFCQNRPEGGATLRIELPVASGHQRKSPDRRPFADMDEDDERAGVTLTLPPTP